MDKPIKKPTEKKRSDAEMVQRIMSKERLRAEALSRGLHQRTPEAKARAHEPVTRIGGQTTEMAFEPSYGTLGKGDAKAPAGVKEVMSKPKAKIKKGPGEEAMLDAYWGSYGDTESRSFLSSTSTRIIEVVLGTDERKQIGTTISYPWRCICSLRIRSADGTSFIGTGWLVAPRVVLTAGHCVYMHDYGGWAEEIEVIPGRDGSEKPYGSATCNSMSSVSGWVHDRDSNSDYGVIYLPEDKRFGDELGTIGFKSYSDDELEDAWVNISGYPGDKPSGTQWHMAQEISSITDEKLSYMIDTYGGQSGAPVWRYMSNGTRHGVGIHVNGSTSGNSATRINKDVFNNIVYWIGQAP